MTGDDRLSLLDAARETGSTNVVLLDPATDRIVGEMEKLEAHQQGRYHAAMSVLLFRGDNAQLVQRRAQTKYHSGGLWANACCSHPRPGENIAHAASRRLQEELGVVTPVTEIGTIRYRCRVTGGNGFELIEHEHVRLFFGRFEGPVQPNPEEVDAVKWAERTDASDIGAKADLTPWFRLYLRIVCPDVIAHNMEPNDFGFFDLGDEI